jgi:hypothetical protein
MRIAGKAVELHSFSASALDGGEWLTSHLGRFTLGKEHPYPLNKRLGGPQGRSGRFGEIILPQSHFDEISRNVISFFSHCFCGGTAQIGPRPPHR